MTARLVDPDVTEHAPVVLPALAGPPLLLLYGLVETLYGRETSLGAYRAYVATIGAVAILLARYLLALPSDRELMRFFEALPVRRGSVFLARALAGAAVLAAELAVGVVLCAGVRQLAGELMLWPHPFVLPEREVARGALFVATVYSGALLLAALGRHRFVVEAAVVGAALAAHARGTDLLSLPPLSLLPGASVSPGEDSLAAAAAAFAVLCAAGGLALATVRSGALARAWAGPARGADRARAGAVLVVALMAAVAGRARPVAAPDGQTATADGVAVRVASPEAAGRARALAIAVGADLAALRDELDLAAVPAVWVDVVGGLGAARHERAHVPGRDGLVVRTDLLDPAWDLEAFRAWLDREALDVATAGRLQGAAGVVLDGYAGERHGRAGRAVEQARAAWGLSALARSGDAVEAWLSDWVRVRRRLGDPVARAVAGWVLAELGRERGEEALRALARAVVAGPPTERSELAARVEATTGWSLRRLGEHLTSRTPALLAAHEAALAAIPDVEASARLDARASGSEVVLVLTSAPRPGGRVAVLHGVAGRDEVPFALARDEVGLDGRAVECARRYRPGDGIDWTPVAYAAPLECDVIGGWTTLWPGR